MVTNYGNAVTQIVFQLRNDLVPRRDGRFIFIGPLFIVPWLIVGMVSCLATLLNAGTSTFTYDWEFSEGVWEGEPTYGYFAGNGAGFDSRVSHGISDGAGDLDYSADPNDPVFYSVNPDPIDPQVIFFIF